MQPRGQTDLPVPVTIVAGFLGAGKTTLLNRILTSEHGRRIAVVVNDFGSINIDADLVTDVGEGMVSLANGCICCAVRSDLISAVLDLCSSATKPDHIIIESSGVADPNSVFRAFLQPEIRNSVLLDGVITVVDAEQVLEIEEQERDLAIDQIRGGDLIILNKVDLVDERALAETRYRLEQIKEKAQVLDACHCNLPIEILLGDGEENGSAVRESDDKARSGSAGGKDAGNLPGPLHEHGDHHHQSDFETWTYISDRPLRLGLLNQVISHLPKQVFRVKGFIFAADDPGKRHVLQMVGRRAVLSSDQPWGDGPRQTKLVFIARRGICNVPAIKRALEKCLDRDAVHD